MKNFFLFLLLIILAAFLMFYGEAGFSNDPIILNEIRIPKIVTAIFAGGLLGLSGLLIQVLFQNPIAGPDILGVSSGSILFVALWTLGVSFIPENFYLLGQKVFAFFGASAITVLLLFLSKSQKSKLMVLIIGILLTSLIGSIVAYLVNNSASEAVRSYLFWGQGSFRNVLPEDLKFLILSSLLGGIPLFFIKKLLNIYSLGENQAKLLGVNVGKLEVGTLVLSSWFVTISTVSSGPIAFLGIVAPFLAKKFHKTFLMEKILLGTFITGSLLALICECIITIFPNHHLTINTIMGFIGAPILIYFLLNKHKKEIY